MVDVSDKAVSERVARASASIQMSPQALAAVQENRIEKGEVLSIARVAGIQAAKKCSDLIPLCHPLALSKVEVGFEVKDDSIQIKAMAKLKGQTGVEMEALTAASVAALTIYDMCKAIDKGMVIEHVQLEEKTGGKSGAWRRYDG